MGNPNFIKEGEITQNKILEWLFEFEYSNAEILQKSVNRSRSAIDRTLKRMKQDGLVKLYKPQLLRHNIWGITLSGVARIAGDDFDENRVFRFSKFNEFSALHHYDIQNVKIYIKKNGFNFYHTRREKIGNKGKVPDGIMETKKGDVAVEVERTIKSKKRYQQIWGSYVNSINKGEYIGVNYFLTHEDTYRLKNIFSNTEKLTLDNKNYKFSDSMKSKFAFSNFV